MCQLVLSNLGHTWILDLDGTIVKHNGYKVDGADTLLHGAKEFLKSIPKQDMVIFVTSRDEACRHETIGFLRRAGIRYDHVIFGAPYGERILMNDDKPSGLCMGYSVTVNRDDVVYPSITIDDGL